MMSVPKYIGTILLFCTPLFAQSEPLTRAQFDKQMSSLQKRDQQLREQIAQEQTSITELKKQLEATRQRIASLRRKKLSLVGITEEGLADFTGRAEKIKEDLARLMSAGDDRFLADSTRFQSLKKQAETMKSRRAAKLRSVRPLFAAITEQIAEAQERYRSLQQVASVDEAVIAESESSSMDQTTYTVANSSGTPETLYGIAKKVYGDPYQWMRIYQANKSVIDRNFNRLKDKNALRSIAEPSDLIFPGQVLTIPR